MTTRLCLCWTRRQSIQALNTLFSSIFTRFFFNDLIDPKKKEKNKDTTTFNRILLIFQKRLFFDPNPIERQRRTAYHVCMWFEIDILEQLLLIRPCSCVISWWMEIVTFIYIYASARHADESHQSKVKLHYFRQFWRIRYVCKHFVCAMEFVSSVAFYFSSISITLSHFFLVFLFFRSNSLGFFHDSIQSWEWRYMFFHQKPNRMMGARVFSCEHDCKPSKINTSANRTIATKKRACVDVYSLGRVFLFIWFEA